VVTGDFEGRGTDTGECGALDPAVTGEADVADAVEGDVVRGAAAFDTGVGGIAASGGIALPAVGAVRACTALVQPATVTASRPRPAARTFRREALNRME
jgi:hypothetical protein